MLPVSVKDSTEAVLDKGGGGNHAKQTRIKTKGAGNEHNRSSLTKKTELQLAVGNPLLKH